MLGEAINWLFVLIAVVTTGVIVCVFLPDHISLLIVEKLQIDINVLEPFVSVDLLYRQAFVRIDFQ